MFLCEIHKCHDKVYIDSCGISPHCGGKEADARIKQAALKYDVTIDHISKPFDYFFFEVFDLILAVDLHVKEYLLSICPIHCKHKIKLASFFSQNYFQQPMTDPYEKGDFEYETTFEIAWECCEGILKKVKENI
jgi:protein-tyrosine phosphatase